MTPKDNLFWIYVKNCWKKLNIHREKGALFYCPPLLLEPDVHWGNIETYVKTCNEYKTKSTEMKLNIFIIFLLFIGLNLSSQTNTNDDFPFQVSYQDCGSVDFDDAYMLGKINTYKKKTKHPHFSWYAYGDEVLYGFKKFNKKANYLLVLHFYSRDKERSFEVKVDGVFLDQIKLPQDSIIIKIYTLQPSLIKDSEVVLSLEKVEGSEAFISAIEIYSDINAPLSPLTDFYKEEGDLHKAIPRISPIPSNIEGISTIKMSLNGEWKFNPTAPKTFKHNTDTKTWNSIEVPGEWTLQGFEVEENSYAGYQKVFEVPEDWKNKQVKLRFESVYSTCEVFVNGHKTSEHTSSFNSFEIDITPYILFDEKNTLSLRVKSESRIDEQFTKGSHYAKHQIGGVLRDVYMFALPEVNVSELGVRTLLSNDYQDATLKLRIGLTNESDADAKNLSLSCTLLKLGIKGANNADESPIDVSYTEIKNIKNKQTEVLSIEKQIKNPELWHAETPCLYELELKLKQGDKVRATTKERIGFREVKKKGNQVYVNGKRLKLRGVCRHSIHPLTGRSNSFDLVKKDIEIFKRANCNFVRTSHYPPEKELLDLCDEYGLFVMNEVPACWVYDTIPYNEIRRLTFEMFARDRNHPSIIIWSQANESGWSHPFKKSVLALKEIDPDRLVMFSHSEYLGLKGRDVLDIGTKHYPGAHGPEKYKNYFRPIIFDEFVHVNAYNEREFLTDPGVRSQWGPYVDRMWSNILNSPGSLGGAVWGGIDEIFFLPDSTAVGYGPWGFIDGWRREKPEFWGLKKSYSPVKIDKSRAYIQDQKIIIKVENRYDVADFSTLNITWKYGNQDGKIKSSLSAGDSGHLIIPLNSPFAENGFLELKVTDRNSVLIDQYKIEVGRVYHLLPVENKLTENLDVNVLENQYKCTGKDFEFNINRQSGLIDHVAKDNKQIISGGPFLMMLPHDNNKVDVINGIPIDKLNNEDYSAFMNGFCSEWKCTKTEITEQSKTQITITSWGEYKEAWGRFIYTIKSDGSFDINYIFDVKETISPRQLGVVLQFENEYNNLSWQRRGYFSYYPENNIDRLAGTAKPFNTNTVCDVYGPRTKPEYPWKDDMTIYGTSDFRSTKHNIYKAELYSEDKHGIVVEDANATHHVRCWVNGKNNYMAVNYFSHAGSEHYFRYQVRSDKISLNPEHSESKSVEDTVKFRLK